MTVPPSVEKEHDEVTVIVNNPAQLSCQVSGIPPPTISWRKVGENSTVIENTDDSVILPNGALRVHHVSVDDAGMYECFATSIAGNASKTVMLNVQGENSISDGMQ